jgi:hypothetical protein
VAEPRRKRAVSIRFEDDSEILDGTGERTQEDEEEDVFIVRSPSGLGRQRRGEGRIRQGGRDGQSDRLGPFAWVTRNSDLGYTSGNTNEEDVGYVFPGSQDDPPLNESTIDREGSGSCSSSGSGSEHDTDLDSNTEDEEEDEDEIIDLPLPVEAAIERKTSSLSLRRRANAQNASPSRLSSQQGGADEETGTTLGEEGLEGRRVRSGSVNVWGSIRQALGLRPIENRERDGYGTI